MPASCASDTFKLLTNVFGGDIVVGLQETRCWPGEANVPGFEMAFSSDSSCTLAWPTAMGHLLNVSPQTVGSTVGIGLNETCTLCKYLPDSSYPVAVYSEAIENMKMQASDH